jgi:hypothetical protein
MANDPPPIRLPRDRPPQGEHQSHQQSDYREDQKRIDEKRRRKQEALFKDDGSPDDMA